MPLSDAWEKETHETCNLFIFTTVEFAVLIANIADGSEFLALLAVVRCSTVLCQLSLVSTIARYMTNKTLPRGVNFVAHYSYCR